MTSLPKGRLLLHVLMKKMLQWTCCTQEVTTVTLRNGNSPSNKSLLNDCDQVDQGFRGPFSSNNPFQKIREKEWFGLDCVSLILYSMHVTYFYRFFLHMLFKVGSYSCSEKIRMSL